MTLSWHGTASPWSNGHGLAYATCWSEEIGLFVAVGFATSSTVGSVLATSTDGKVWVGGSIASAPGDGTNTQLRGVCWSPSLGIFLAVGGTTHSSNNVWTSPDAITWTGRGYAVDSGAFMGSCCWSEDLGIFVVGAIDSTHVVATSPDGTTWTTRTTPWDGHSGRGEQIAWGGPPGIFVLVGSANDNSDPFHAILTSPDGTTWTARNINFPRFGSNGVAWNNLTGKFWVNGFADTGFDDFTGSSDGLTWSGFTRSGGGGVGPMCEAETLVLLGGGQVDDYDGVTYHTQSLAPLHWSAEAVAFSRSLDRAIAVGGGDGPINGLFYTDNVTLTVPERIINHIFLPPPGRAYRPMTLRTT